MGVDHSLFMGCDRVLLVYKSSSWRSMLPLRSWLIVSVQYIVNIAKIDVTFNASLINHLSHQVFKFTLDSLSLFLQVFISDFAFTSFVIED